MNKELVARLGVADARNDELFTELFQEAANELGMSDAELAEKLRVSRPTVTRWKEGRSLPHPAIRPPIFIWLTQLIEVKGTGEKR